MKKKTYLKISSIILVVMVLLSSCKTPSGDEQNEGISGINNSSDYETTSEFKEPTPVIKISVDPKPLSAKVTETALLGESETCIQLTKDYIITKIIIPSEIMSGDGSGSSFKIIIYDRQTFAKKITSPIFPSSSSPNDEILLHENKLYFCTSNKKSYDNYLIKFDINTGKYETVYSYDYHSYINAFSFASNNKLIIDITIPQNNTTRKAISIDLKTKKDVELYDSIYIYGVTVKEDKVFIYVRSTSLYNDKILVTDTSGKLLRELPCPITKDMIDPSVGYYDIGKIHTFKDYMYIQTSANINLLQKDDGKMFQLANIQRTDTYELVENQKGKSNNNVVFINKALNEKSYVFNPSTDTASEFLLTDTAFSKYMTDAFLTYCADGNGNFFVNVVSMTDEKSNVGFLVTLS